MRKDPSIRKIWIDVAPNDIPYIGLFILAIGRDGRKVNSVYMVKEWREIKRRQPDPDGGKRYGLTVQRGYTYADTHGTQYWTMRWNPRTAKKKLRKPSEHISFEAAMRRWEKRIAPMVKANRDAERLTAADLSLRVH